MEAALGFALTLLGLWPGVFSAYVEQPAFLTGSPGGSVTIPCQLGDTGKPWMFWYRSEAGKAMEALFNSHSSGDITRLADAPLEAEREGTRFELRFPKLQPSDSAVYYCACSPGENSGSYALYFGPGTKLTVLEDGLNVTQPSVVLFDPSPQELREKGKATLVCLATNFYPDHVTLRWSVNGVETTTGVKTDDSPTRGSDRMYSLSSRLRLPKRDWRNPHNTFRCSVYFDPKNITVSKETKGREGCGGVTPDSYRTSANTAKLTYVLLISKSALYGLFVTFLAWKLKACREKPFI